MKVRGQEWRRRAVCLLETPDAPELWTPERRPPRHVRVHLEQMCRSCPVQQQCAADAVVAEAESGMYVGVWVPHRKEKTSWGAAMDELRRVASLSQVDAQLAELEASA